MQRLQRQNDKNKKYIKRHQGIPDISTRERWVTNWLICFLKINTNTKIKRQQRDKNKKYKKIQQGIPDQSTKLGRDG